MVKKEPPASSYFDITKIFKILFQFQLFKTLKKKFQRENVLQKEKAVNV